MTRRPTPPARAAVLAALLAAASPVAMPAAAQTAVGVSGAGAVGALVRQADYWRQRERKDLAAQALQRAYAAAPRDPDVLAAFARAAIADNDRAAFDRWIQQLKAVAPNDPRVAGLQTTQRAIPPAQAIAQARRLAQSGQAAQAVAAYRALFDGKPPPMGYRLEYYQTLTGVPANWEEGRAGLARLLAENPDNLQVRLAYAQALTYRDNTRRDGIARLAALRGGPPDIGQQAVRAWRQALIWLGAGQADKPLYQAFLASSPNDAEITAKLAQIDAQAQKAAAERAAQPPPDKGGVLREQGYAALQKKDDATAEARFQDAIKLKPTDADALGGLGLLRLRAQNFTEARTLLQRAIAAAPASRARWAEALASAEFYAGLKDAQAAAAAGDWAKAEALARPLAQGDNPDRRLAQQQLADALMRQGKAGEAEPIYRQLLAALPASADLRNGLVDSLIAQNRFAEADVLAQNPAQRAALGAARGRIELARANQLWTSGDRAGANAAFETALAARPDDPWTRYDFARFLCDQGSVAAAEGLMAPLAAAGTPESLYVAALFNQRQNRPNDAYALVAQVPAAARTADMTRLIDQLRLSAAIADAEGARTAGRPMEALAALRAIAGQPGLTLGDRAQVANALYDLGDSAQALAMAEAALSQPGKDAPAAYDGFVSVLAKAGRDAEASALIRQLAAQPGAQTAGRQALTDLSVTLAAERADRLRLTGDLAGSFDTLSATFPIAPDSPRLLGALGRLYQAGGLTDQAGAAYEQLLRIRPGDQDALVGAAQAAIARQDWTRARQTLSQAMAHAPNDADLYLMAASVEEGQGDKKAAVKALETAKSLRLRSFTFTQAGGRPAPGAGPLGPNPFARGGYAPAGPGAPSLQPQAFQAPGYQPYAAAFPATPAAMASPMEGPRFQPATWQPADAPSSWSPPFTAPQAMPEPSQPLWRTATPPVYAPPPAASPPTPAQPMPTSPTADRSYLYGPYPAQPPAPAAVPAQAWPPAYAAPAYGSPAAQPYGPAALAQGRGAPPAGGPFARVAPAGSAADPLVQSIDDRIATLTATTQPAAEARAEYRGRSGAAGLSRLSDVSANISAAASPFSFGQLKVSLQPVALSTGTPTAAELKLFGTNPIASGVSLITKGDPLFFGPAQATASGVGTDLSFQAGPLAIDVGTTPIGFQNLMMVGGVSWTQRLGKGLEAKIFGERRAVTDSLTAYAGVTDTGSGYHWGQVLRTTEGGSLSYDTPGGGVYADGSISSYAGSNVADNKSFQINAGAYIRPYRKGDDLLQIGLNLNHQEYDNNQNFFTLGQGGYFSPQTFTSLSLPVSLKIRRGNWDFELEGVPGYQTYRQQGEPFFPVDGTLQGTVIALAKINPQAATGYGATSSSGFGVLGRGQAEYRLSANTRVGATASFNNFGDYTETRAAIYARQALGTGVR